VPAAGHSSTTQPAWPNKLRKVSTAPTAQTRHYVDGIEYNGNTIDIIHTGEGLARNNAGTYTFEYNLTDHLGNVRYSFKKDPGTGALTTLQTDNYYPFGLQKALSGGVNNYLYNGKELQTELTQYDYGARFYDPVIGRFNTIDPHGEKYASWTSYNYAFNDPINTIDPDGRDGMLTGSGTKDDPYIIHANYYYVKGSLKDKEVESLRAGISDYNGAGGKNGIQIKNEHGTTSYLKYDLSATEVADADEADKMIYEKDSFTDTNGESQSFGNKFGLGASLDDLEYGDADNRNVAINRENISKGVKLGMDESRLMRGVVIHEIGHNLGGEHSDGTATMRNPRAVTYESSIKKSQTDVQYSDTSKNFTRTIFQRRDAKKSGLIVPGIYTKK